MRNMNPVTGVQVGEVQPTNFLRSNEASSKKSRSS